MNELKKSHRHGMLKATHRADFKIEELVEFVRAASSSEEEFKTPLQACMRHLIWQRVAKKTPAKQNLVGHGCFD